jgi:hypothetical protein
MAYERHYDRGARGNSRTRGTSRGRGRGRIHRNSDYDRNIRNDRHGRPNSTRRGRGGRDNNYRRRPHRSINHDPRNGSLHRPEKGNVPSRQQPEQEGDEIQQLRRTIASLQTKLDQISKPQGSNATTSSNPDFADVAKTIYKWAQLKHHRCNWQQVPRSIYGRIDQLVADIKPPNGNDDLRGLLLSLSTKFAMDIRDTVCRHLDAQLRDTETHAGTLDPKDLPRAKDIASRYLKSRLGRLDANQRDALVSDAAEMVGISRTQPSARNLQSSPHSNVNGSRHASPPPRDNQHSTTGDGTQSTSHGRHASPHLHDGGNLQSSPRVQENQLPARRTQTDVTATTSRTEDWILVNGTQSARKRRASDTPVYVRSRNPFSPLSANNDDDNTMDYQPTTDLRTQPKKSKPSDNKSSRSVRIFRDDKDRWSFDVSPTTTNIVIGDSNLQRITRVPANWQIEALPGARLRHVTQAISRMTIPTDRHVNIILQAGINHRDKPTEDFTTSLEHLMEQLGENKQVDRIFYAGIPASNRLPEAENVAAINRCIIDIVGQDNYILPLTSDQLLINSPDKYGIHYDAATADRILNKIYRFVEGKDF